jgi:hypothetical protein
MMKRRQFIKTAGAAPLVTYFPSGLNDITRVFSEGKIEKRSLGKTGEKLLVG